VTVRREDGFRWNGVPARRYDGRAGAHLGVSCQVLAGEAPHEAALNFVTRYFEIEPGGYTSLEHHGHPHTVVVVRGRGSVVLDATREPIAPLDCVYVGPHVRHQFRADAGETLGFLCVVDRVRDRPVRESERQGLRGEGEA
jgi:quercetin dioxygenase-like cupin family protein